jgi:hypothetical protein
MRASDSNPKPEAHAFSAQCSSIGKGKGRGRSRDALTANEMVTLKRNVGYFIPISDQRGIHLR